MKILFFLFPASVLILSCSMEKNMESPPFVSKVELGEMIFFDSTLSQKKNQSCASCHSPATGWSGATSKINAGGSVYEGSIASRFGNRKPPTAAYASFNPVLHVVPEEDNLVVGGNFWDGRATGEKLGSPVADQAQGPFLNPLEHALPESACVVHQICNGVYAKQFKQHWPQNCTIFWPNDIEQYCRGEKETLSITDEIKGKIDQAYDNIALTIAEFESSSKVNAFTSKYDYYLAEKASLTDQELKGLELFNNKGKCAECHPSTSSTPGVPPLFTDFTYDNLGIPKNLDNPFYTQKSFNPDGMQWQDKGLGGFLSTRSKWKDLAQANIGKHKVPTLRNVDKRPRPSFVKAFGHNGYFKSLKEFVHFYNTRDVLEQCSQGSIGEKKSCWPIAEVGNNVNTTELGNLKLTNTEEDAIVAFMKTLSDGYQP
ncbi:MAG: cytochrome c peroxidase [Bacteroidota bacterium]